MKVKINITYIHTQYTNWDKRITQGMWPATDKTRLQEIQTCMGGEVLPANVCLMTLTLQRCYQLTISLYVLNTVKQDIVGKI